MRRLVIAILTTCLALSSWAFRGQKQPEHQQQIPPSQAAASPEAKITYAPDRDYDLLKVSLDLRTDYDHLTLSGTAVNRLAPLRGGLTDIAFDCGANLKVEACALDGQPAAFTRSGDKLKISTPGPLERGRPVDLEVR